MKTTAVSSMTPPATSTFARVAGQIWSYCSASGKETSKMLIVQSLFTFAIRVNTRRIAWYVCERLPYDMCRKGTYRRSADT